ncbi:B12-binding domain-containing radical SAM protein [Streptomyces sp. NPDC054863]
MPRHSVLLMVPPQQYGYGYINDFFWQEGLLYLASYLKKRFGPELELEICDGNHRTMDECRQVLRQRHYDLVGFHCIDHTRDATFELVELAAQHGCRRIAFGGAGAIFGPEQYLRAAARIGLAAEAVVGACTDAGEYTIEAMLLDTPADRIPNFVHLDRSRAVPRIRRSRKVAGRPGQQEYLDQLPFELYTEIFDYFALQLSRPDYPYRPLTYSGLSHEGCPHRVWRDNTLVKSCSFCAIPARKLAYRPAGELWERIGVLDRLCRERLDTPLNSIKDWGDSLTPRLLRDLIDLRPAAHSAMTYSGYLSVADMTPRMLDALREMNCWSLYMGVDGTSDNGLEFLEKGYSVPTLWERLQLLRDHYDFRIEVGVILGVEGETPASLTRSVEAVRRVSEMFGERVVVVQGNMLVPMPGSMVFSSLARRARDRHLGDPLDVDVQGRIALWLEEFTQVSFDECAAAQAAIEAISPRRHSYSMPRS